MLWPLLTIVLLDTHLHLTPDSRWTANLASRSHARPAVAVCLVQASETVTAIRVQGNTATPDADVIRMAGVRIGAPVAPGIEDEVATRLRATKQFQRVEVRKRFASIDDPSQIVLVIVVDEGPVSVQLTGDPDRPTRVVKTHRPNLLVLPIVTAEDGYGVTYGARLAVPNPVGPRSQLSFPLTWGGTRRAAIEADKTLETGPITHLQAGASLTRLTHPFFRRPEDRRRVWIRSERDLTRSVRIGATGGWQHVSFLDRVDSFAHAGADVVLDTRADPMLARNAVFARAAIDRFRFGSRDGTTRSNVEARAYVGLIGQVVLIAGAARQDASSPLPDYLRGLLGGMTNVRGFAAGTAIGDTLVTG